MANSTTNAIIGFLTGALVGSGAGILFAPEKGDRTRKKIKKSAKKLRLDVEDDVDEKVNDLKDIITTFMDDVQGRLAELERELKEKNTETEKEDSEEQKKAKA